MLPVEPGTNTVDYICSALQKVFSTVFFRIDNYDASFLSFQMGLNIPEAETRETIFALDNQKRDGLIFEQDALLGGAIIDA